MSSTREIHTEFGRWELAEAVQAECRPLHEEVADYLAAQPSAYQDLLGEGMEFMAAHATPAFTEVVAPKVGAGMLIGCQEQAYAPVALAQYASQHKRTPHKIVGMLNWTEDTPKHRIQQMRGILNDFIDRNEHVPFAYCEMIEEEPIRMGRLRRHLTDWMLLQTAHPTMGDVLLTHQDADLELLGPLLFSQAWQQHATKKYPFISITPSVTHTRWPNLPNMNKVLDWFDSPLVMRERAAYFEPGPFWSARAYMRTGYKPDCHFGETHHLLDDMHQGHSTQHPARLWLPGTFVQSPRRLYTKLYSSLGPTSFWTGEDNDLTADDDYRNYGDMHFSGWSDIQDQTRDRQLRYMAVGLFSDAFIRGLYLQPQAPEKLFGTVRRRLERRRKALGGPEDMFDHAEAVARRRVDEVVSQLEATMVRRRDR